MGPCSLFWVCAIICMIAFKPYVYCSPCSGPNECVVTDYTTATCDATAKQCTCSSGYFPIRTGCGIKLSQPTIITEEGRFEYLFTGTSGTLRCSDVLGAASYLWTFPNGTKYSSQTLTVTTPGAYSCQAISKTESLNSDQSNQLNVQAIGGTAITYQIPLLATVNNDDPQIFTGNSITFTCLGVPMGYSGRVFFTDGSNNALVTSVASSVSAQYVMAADKTGLACNLETTNLVSFRKSANTVTLPTVASPNPITAVTITVMDSIGDINSVPTYNVGTDGPILTCTTTPVPAFLDSTKKVTYNFQVGATSKQNNESNTYKVDISAAGSTTYKCAATHNSVTVETTLSFPINVDTSYFTAPDVTMTAPTAIGSLRIGSTLVLSCGASKDSSLSYTWFFNDTIIDGQTDFTIQLFNFVEADIGVYKCRALKSRYVTNSIFHAIMVPTIIRTPVGTTYGEGGDYVLKCNSGSAIAAGWTYSWKKDNKNISITTDSYTIKNANATTHNGAYTCTTTYNGATRTSSENPVAIEAAGLRCTTANQGTTCTSPRYSGTCTAATIQVCACASYFVPRGDACELIKPTISRDAAGTVFYAGSTYVLTCNTASNVTTGWTFAWKKDTLVPLGSTSTYTITGANATTHNGSYTCTTTYNTVSSTSDALIVSVIASATAPFINCALMVIMAALGSLFI